MIVAAALCPAPPLLAPGLTGQAELLPDLRHACAVAVARLVAVSPDVIAVVGPADLTATWDPAGLLNLTAYAPALALAVRDNSKKRSGLSDSGAGERPALPLALGIGATLLDKAGWDGPRALWSVGGSAPAAECARLGHDLAAPAERIALLVMGDGSARRSAAAPGYLDERAEPFDAEVERAVRDGDWGSLAALDPALAADLMVSGRPAWQTLAAALGAGVPDGALRTEVLYSDAPFGVTYLVACIQCGG